MKRRRRLFFLSFLIIFLLVGVYGAYAWAPIAVVDDPLVRMPGTQPNQVTLEAPGRCLNCHAGYDPAVEPGFNWKGSMMAQSARDFLFWSCLTVAAQDSIWAVGTPNATDICERCHFPKGWLEGRSDPTNASLMTGADYDGVQCDFCHRMYDPFFETTYAGTREGNDWLAYWDETNASGTPSQPAADATYAEDMTLAQSILQFNGANFFTNNLPPVQYTENGSGQFFVSPNADKRASFADAAARHQMLYSRYHKSKYMCDTCHDVSNPILANLGADPAQSLPSELNSAFSYFHVERTFSEFMLSAYGLQGGAATNPEFQAQGAPGISQAAKCQDCHMRDVVGPGADKRDAVIRPNQSIEHPNSGQPLHDLTGGNAWVSWVLASAVPGSPNYDATNDQLLNQGAAVLTLDLNQGEGVDPAALLAGVDRAKQQLLLAATIKNLSYDSSSGALSFQVQNNTGHKLISGFPEGRRMFVNIKAYAGGSLIYEANPYDAAAGTLKGLDYPYLGQGLPDPQSLVANEAYVDELIFEMKPSSTDLTGETKTFHFALATGRYKDNRIPPKGFDIGRAAARVSVPVWHGVEDPNHFTAAEYSGGYDDVLLTIPAGADTVEVSLYYQTTSREYIEFLRDEINGTGNLTLSSPTPSGEANAYVIQTDPFFGQLKAWGDTLWNLWTHNMNVDGAAPFLMTSASVGAAPPICGVSAPTLDAATPGHTQVTLDWSAATGATGYNVYYDQAGKAQLVADAGNTTTFTDTGLTNGVEYCYKVTAYDATCESGFSNILCATPQNQGQTTDPAGVSTMKTGIYTGKGKDKTFTLQTIFNVGDSVVIRATVVDNVTGLPVADATVDL
ncbi:MAG: multiheme c-type cytochrome, partial [Chloroflexota bacterium]